MLLALALLPLCNFGMAGADATPSLRVFAPIEGDVVGASVIVGGASSALSHVQVQLDDGVPQNASGTDAWSLSLDLLGLGAGAHRLVVRGSGAGAPLEVVRNVTYDPTIPAALVLEQQVHPSSAVVGETVLLSGFVRTDRQVRLQQGLVQVRLEGHPQVTNGTVDLLGSFTLAIVVPMQPGTLRLTTTIDATALNLSATGTQSLQVTSPQGADLSVEAVELLTDPPISNLSLNLSVRLRNNGTEAVAVTVRLYDGPPSTETLVQTSALTLPAGVMHKELALQPRSAGTHSLVVNLTSGATDPDGTNDERTLEVVVQARPRLSVQGLLLATTAPMEQRPVSVRVGASNGGDAAATCRLVVDARKVDATGIPLPGSTAELVVSQQLALASGQEQILSGSTLDAWTPSSGGHWQLRAAVLESDPADPDLSDDSVTLLVDVLAQPIPKVQPTPSPSLPLLLCALLLGAALRRRATGA